MSSAFGASLLAYWEGEVNTKLIIEREDGYRDDFLVESLFKEPSEWPEEELLALKHIPPESTVLDIGCGASRIAIFLQNKGHEVVGLDSCPEALKISRDRSLRHTYLSNICSLEEPPVFDQYDAVLMLGNNFGVCGDISETEMLLKKLNTFLGEDGLLIFSCRDPLITDKPQHFAYQENNRQRGRPPGLIRIRIIYLDLIDDWWDLLFADAVMAEEIINRTGFEKVAIYQNPASSIYFMVTKKK